MNSTLITSLWPQLRTSLALQVLVVALGSIILTLSAKIQVPFWPVPMTMQTGVVVLFGAAMGWKLAGATVLAYLAQGALGLPVFSKGGGLAYLAGPTGGYLIGFLAAAVLVGWLIERGYGRSLVTAFLAILAGDALIFAMGAGWLSTLIGFEKAIAVGVVPFLPAEALKVALACAVLALLGKKAA